MPIVPVWRYASVKDYKSRNSIGGSYVPVNCTVADLFRYSLDNGAFEGHVVPPGGGVRSIVRFRYLLSLLIGRRNTFALPMTIGMLKLAIKGLCHSLWA